MSIDRETVRKVASLARIGLDETEIDKFTPQVAGILTWIEQLQSVNTDDVLPLSCVVDIDSPMRADVVNDGGIAQDILSNAPEQAEGFFVVPKVVE